MEKETGIQNITLYSLVDYIIIICCLLKRIDFTGMRAQNLLATYKRENQNLQNAVTTSIYNVIMQQSVPTKINLLESYLNK